MKLIVGLGNPGDQYQNTRHNIGFMVLEQFLKDCESTKDTLWSHETRFKADVAEITWHPHHSEPERVLLVKPKTYMNNSGMAVSLLANFYKVNPEDIWVVHDEVDLRLGALRIRRGGGSAGHRGIESILEAIPSGDFWRFRLGIGRPEETAGAKGIDGFVLGNFTHQEHAKIRELIKHAAQAMKAALEDGLEASSNKFNTK